MESLKVSKWLVLPSLLLLVFWLGARGLTADAIWGDEFLSLWRAGDPRLLTGASGFTITTVIEQTQQAYYQVPGYYLLLAAWGRLAGLDVVTGRALSALLGLLTVAWIYRLGCDLHSHMAGLGAAFVLGIGVFFVNYLHELRGYTLLLLLTLAFIWSYWRVMQRGSRSAYILLFLSTVAMIYTHYAGFVMLGTVGLYHLFVVPKTRRWWKVTLLLVAAGIAFLPWWPNLEFSLAYVPRDPREERALSATDTVKQVLFWAGNGSALWLLSVIAFALPAYRKAGPALIWLLLAVGLGLALLANAALHFMYDLRYVLVFWIPLALLAGIGIASLAQRGIRPRWILSLWLLVGLWVNLDGDITASVHDPLYHAAFDQLAMELQPRAGSGDMVVMLSRTEDFRRGSYDVLLAYYLDDLDLPSTVLHSAPDTTAAVFAQRVQQIIDRQPRRVWLFTTPSREAWGRAEFGVEMGAAGYGDCGTVLETKDLHLDLIVSAPESGWRTYQGNGDTVEVVLVQPLPEAAGDDLPVLLGWRLGEGVRPGKYSLGLHLAADDGAVVAQYDMGMDASGFHCLTTHFDSSKLPAGRYALNLYVYAWESGIRLIGPGDRLAEIVIR